MNLLLKHRTKIFIALFAILAYFSFLLLRPFLITIVSALILSYVLYPVYRMLKKRIKNDTASALITILIVIIVIALPLVLIINTISQEVVTFYITTKQQLSSGIIDITCDKGMICSLLNGFNSLFGESQLGLSIEEFLKHLSQYLINSSSRLFLGFSTVLLHFFIMLYLMFYLFKDGSKLVRNLRKILPMKKSHEDRMFNKFNDVTHAIVYGHFITALVQGGIGAVGYLIFGVPSPLLWGLVTVFVSIIPFVGPPLIWVPAGIIRLYSATTAQDYWGVAAGIGLLVYGFLIISTVDNLIKPKIIGSRAQIHPTIVLIGVLGGIAMMGFIGIFIGPLALALLITFFQLMEEGNET